jgi:Peptidase family M41
VACASSILAGVIREKRSGVGTRLWAGGHIGVLGDGQGSSSISPHGERERVAYHEVGHALTALACPHADPVHRVSIVPRGVAAGCASGLPRDEGPCTSLAGL